MIGGVASFEDLSLMPKQSSNNPIIPKVRPGQVEADFAVVLAMLVIVTPKSRDTCISPPGYPASSVHPPRPHHHIPDRADARRPACHWQWGWSLCLCRGDILYSSCASMVRSTGMNHALPVTRYLRDGTMITSSSGCSTGGVTGGVTGSTGGAGASTKKL